MSSYTCFYLRRNDVFVPIGSYGRSHVIARYFNAPWEKCVPLTREKLIEVKSNIIDYKESLTKSINSCVEKIEFIRSLNNTVDEKMRAFYDIDEEVKETQEEMSEVDYALNFVSFLEGLFYETNYDGIEEGKFIYFGEECGDPMKYGVNEGEEKNE